MQMNPSNSFLEINVKNKFYIHKSVDKLNAQEKKKNSQNSTIPGR